MIDVAIVGIGCRLPGKVSDPNQLWEFLLSRGSGIVEVPADRWKLDRYYDPEPDMPGRMYVRSGGFLQESLWDFDPEFFGVAPREASIMDPQQRLLLEVSQEAMDDAGVSGRVAGRPVGVYVGAFTADNMTIRRQPLTRTAINSHTATAGSFTMLSNRISYVYDLRGPSMTIDTACSSSLVALHEATQAIARGEIELALVGGGNAMLTPETFIEMCKGRFLSADGQCKTFDAAADGYARGEGAGIIVLKPLADATRDQDRVYAVIRATGVNQDGRTSGITVPNPQAQADLIRRVTAQAGLRPEQIGYLEAHGTGTAVGDPLEMAALGQTLGHVEGRTTDLVVGSIKNSIGHLEAAAGVAGVIKAALTLHHRQLAPQASLNQLNPAIPFDEYRLRVITEAEAFPADYALAAASVNGFGYGGTNAHAVLVEAPKPPRAAVRRAPARVLPVSGRNADGARRLAEELLPLVADPSVDPVALADAMWSRRSHHHYRFAVPFGDRDDLLARLTSVVDGSVTGGRTVTEGRAPVFVFSGMGPQWWRMGRDLLTAGGPFACAAAEVDELFADLAGWSLIDELRRDESDSRVTSTAVAQSANFLVQIGLTAELAHYGVVPQAVVGHSVGEVSAAYVSGMLSLADAVRVSYYRSRLATLAVGSGGMLAVGLSEAEVLDWIAGRADLCIAAVNSPSGVTLAGTPSGIAELRETLNNAGVFVRQLRVDVPYHSHLLDPLLPQLTRDLAGLEPETPSVALYSTVTSTPVTGPDWGAEYWCENVRRPVRFADTLAAMIDDGARVFVEVGPHPVLSGNIRESLLGAGVTGTAVGTLKRDADDAVSIRTALADLYVAGALNTEHAPGASEGLPAHCALPAHRFQRQRLWSMDQPVVDGYLGTGDARVLPGDLIDAGQPEWRTELATARLLWLRDHVVAGAVVLPGAAYLDAALAAAVHITGRPAPALDGVRFIAPLVVEDTELATMRLNVESSSGRFTVSSRNGSAAGWTRHACGRIVDGLLRPTLGVAQLTGATAVTADEVYAQLADRGLSYGQEFRRIVEARVSATQVVARVDAAGTGVAASNHQAHPVVLDAALQCVALLVDAGQADAGGAVVPAAIQHVRQFAAIPDQVMVGVTRVTPQPGEAELVADVVLTDPEGHVVVELHRAQFRSISPATPARGELERLWIEPVFEPREARDSRDQTATGERVLVIAAGQESAAWALDYASARGTRQVLVVRGGDPERICTHAEAELRHVLRADPADNRPLVVAVVAVTAPGDGAPPLNTMLRVGELPAMLAGAARAMQNVRDEATRVGGLVPMHGLVITRGALPVPGDGQAPDLAASALVGARRVLRNEQPQLNWRLIDLDHDTALSTVVLESLVSGVHADDAVDEVALRRDRRMVIVNQAGLAGRLEALEAGRPLHDPEANFEIDVPQSAQLADLALREIPRRAPGRGEIELRIDGIGLNFKDPMKVLGVLGADELAGTHFGLGVGMEGIGVVTRVGADVDEVTVGTSMLVSIPGMASRYVTTAVDAGSMEPADGLPMAACGSVVVLMTAHYALQHAAHVAPDDWVLVSAGAGGVGMAAVQIAAKAGARVIATASTPERAELLRSLGAKYVVDSRALSAIDEVRAITGGHGADIVVNCAPGETVAANLEVAAEFGRVVEIGKTEIFAGRLVDLAVFNKNLSVTSIDLDRMMAHRRDLLRQVHREVLSALRVGDYELLLTRVMPVSQVAEAFDQVARSTHLGRIVLDFTEPAPPVKPARPATSIRPDATYLVTGGLGALGLCTARWLAAKDAGRVVLAGRRGVSGPDQQAAVDALRATGCDVRVEQVDVADMASVRGLLDRLADGPPLRGVFHAAGVLADEPLGALSPHGLNAVLCPKARGALILDEALADTELDHFVLYSSVSSQVGLVPQLSYAAASAVLDTLAHHRSRLGRAALSVNWGALAGGMATSSEAISTSLALNGLRLLPLDAATEYLDVAIGLNPIQVSVVDIDWGAWGSMHPASAHTPRFAGQVNAARDSTATSDSVRARLAAMPGEQRVESLTDILADQVSKVLGIPADSVDRQSPLPELGLDSLSAVELRARINATLELAISAMELSRGGGISSLATRLGDYLAAAR
ncbi:type I polyketide synthase [Mycobacterium sp. UM_Kg1]|uniref:type I polyketide synthase n=1 Tax=Mycobacterium sp. UM_Kg1 TaxID=1545691 RepID=UPI00061B2F76|nr:type I polyketide synthase [Mycobacterium sp. UM_Kg1]